MELHSNLMVFCSCWICFGWFIGCQEAFYSGDSSQHRWLSCLWTATHHLSATGKRCKLSWNKCFMYSFGFLM